MDILHKIINNKKLEPVIINPESKFIMVTYWWGNGNLNLNTQKPCRDELIEGQPLTKLPIKFEEMIENWKASCIKAGCNYLVQEYPEFAVPGGYQLAINAKPYFIKKALESANGRGVVYIDGDMTVNRYPSIFDMDNIDFMARGWNIDPRANFRYLSKTHNICFDPFVFETSGGTMYFGNTKNGYKLLDIWAYESSLPMNIGKADDRVLSIAVTAMKLYINMNILQLPMEYLWLTDKYEPEKKEYMYLHKVHYDRDNIVFEHAACLTSEEKAVEQGAAANRQPKFYDKLVEDIMDCQIEGGIFFEYIIFETLNQSEPWKKYLRYLYSAKLYKDDEGDIVHPYYQVPYKKVYGDSKNEIAEINIKKTKEYIEKFRGIKFSKNYIKIIYGKVFNYSNGIIYTPDIIPTILAMHYYKISVLYLPQKFDFTILKKVMASRHDYELALKINNDNEDYPEFDKESPIYLSCNSRILNHIIKMSSDIRELNKNLKSCVLFIQLIRCKFITNIKSSSNSRSRSRYASSTTKQVRSMDRTFNSINVLSKRSKDLKSSFSKLSLSNKKSVPVSFKKIESRITLI